MAVNMWRKHLLWAGHSAKAEEASDLFLGNEGDKASVAKEIKGLKDHNIQGNDSMIAD